MGDRTLQPATLAVHAGAEPDAGTGAVAPPIHLATTFRHGPAGERIAGYEYQREGNPTQDRLEQALAALEGGEAALAFASGMAAITGMLECLPAGARLLIPDDCYSGLRLLARLQAGATKPTGELESACDSRQLKTITRGLGEHRS